jgi:hypothetical protein
LTLGFAQLNKAVSGLLFFFQMPTPNQDLTVETTVSQDLQSAGMYVFMGEVDSENIQPIIEWILHENFIVKKTQKRTTVDDM